MNPHERMTEDADARLLEEAVQTTYVCGEVEISIFDEVSNQTGIKKIRVLRFLTEDKVSDYKKIVNALFIDVDEGIFLFNAEIRKMTWSGMIVVTRTIM